MAKNRAWLCWAAVTVWGPTPAHTAHSTERHCPHQVQLSPGLVPGSPQAPCRSPPPSRPRSLSPIGSQKRPTDLAILNPPLSHVSRLRGPRREQQQQCGAHAEQVLGECRFQGSGHLGPHGRLAGAIVWAHLGPWVRVRMCDLVCTHERVYICVWTHLFT